MATVKAALQPRADRNGLQQLRIIIRSGKQRSFVKIPVKIPAKFWDQKNQKVLPGHAQASVINTALKLRLAELEGRLITAEIAGGVFDIDAIAGQKIKPVDFAEYTRECLRKWHGKKRASTLTGYFYQLNKMQIYAPGLTLQQITADWLYNYELQLRRDKLQDGGILKRMAFISTIVNEAIRNSLIDKSPFTTYRKPPKREGGKVWLTRDELAAIREYALTTNSEPLRNTTWWFLLSCYTGLRYGDVQLFNPAKQIQTGRIILYTQKTGTVVSIKINNNIQECLNQVETIPRVYANQKVNEYLKAIAHHAGIDKSISFHCGRHTFATNCAILGIRKEVTQKLLGHSDIKTTGIYYKIVDLVLDQEMDKWDAAAAG